MALPDLTGQNIQDTYKRVIHTDGTNLYDGTGSLFTVVSASYAVTSSHEVTFEVSSSHAQTADQVGSFTATAIGQTYDTVTSPGQGQLLFTELDNGTDSITITSLGGTGAPNFNSITFGVIPSDLADGSAVILLPENATPAKPHIKVKTDSNVGSGLILGDTNLEDLIVFVNSEGDVGASISQTGLFSGTSTTVVVTDSTANTAFPIVFHNESNGLLDDTGAFEYNPSTGLLITGNISSSGTITSNKSVIGTSTDTYALNVEGGIAAKGVGQANAYRLDDTGGTSRHAIYVDDTNNFLSIGNTNYAGGVSITGNVTASGNISASLGSTISAGALTVGGGGITLAGKLTAGSSEIEGSNFDITGGAIEGCNITVGADKILELREAAAVNVSTINGTTFVATTFGVGSDIQHTGDNNNKIAFGTDTQDLQTGGSSRLDISDSGVRLGGANTRVTTILDEDNMASDSATSLATQQSIKAYVDANAGGSVSGNTFATDLKIGRDADNLIDFTTDNQVTFRVSAGDGIVMKASGEIEATKFDGALEGNADTATALATARNIGGVSFDGTGNIDLPGVNSTGNQNTSGTAAVATTVTITDNENTDEDNAVIFTAGGDVDGGNIGLESDGDLTYNPSTGTLTTTKLTATGDVSSSLTSTGSFGKVEVPGEIRGKMLDIKIANFKGALNGTENYLPISEGELEAVSHTNARVTMIAPYDGRLVKIMMKGSGDTSSHDYVMTFYKYDNGDNTLDTVQQITIASAAMGSSYTANTFEFDQAPISKGDNLVIGLNSNKASNLNYYHTVVFEWDYNS